jgi:hypothetical protein
MRLKDISEGQRGKSTSSKSGLWISERCVMSGTYSASLALYIFSSEATKGREG